MSRSSALAKTLRILKDEHSEVLEKKSIYDHDTNRVVVALARFTSIVEKATNRPTSQKAGEGNSGAGAPPPPPPTDTDIEKSIIEEENKSPEPHPSWVKKAYRAIAMKTHPDRVNADSNISDAQRDRLLLLYKEATDAYGSRNYPLIAEVAAELDIGVEIPPAEFERALETKISSIRKEIAGIQKTVSWVWGTSFGDTQLRLSVTRKCCQIMGIKTPSDEILLDIIRELESTPDFDVIDRLGRVKRIRSGVSSRKVGTRPVKRIGK